MKTSYKGIKLIKHFEGCELTAYRCAGGKKTIGYGTTYYRDLKKDVELSDHISQARAEELLKLDLERFEGYINQYVEVEINQVQFDALVSLVYNIGSGNFKSSTLLKLLNSGDYAGAADQFRMWRKSAGKVLKGLERRRKAESKLFVGCRNFID